MHSTTSALLRVLQLLTCLLIGKIVGGVLLSYRDYMPPDFAAEFLQGRENYFWGGYSWAFYLHVTSGPASLVLGMILLSERFRLRFSRWHRILGRIQVANVLLLVVPSGLWMSWYAMTGRVAGSGFAALAVVTGMCAAFGWRAAMRRRFDVHRLWMLRCYVLLCSAVVLRLMGGVVLLAEIEGEWTYAFSAWTCWLVPLAILELTRLGLRKRELPTTPSVSVSRSQ
ncbi:MAG TPA: DUF2306 domain-containing protein [Planctomycetaceae bacterium]|nr:DUF2306 domain-containing protein [Planctomycetaceae bacterium]